MLILEFQTDFLSPNHLFYDVFWNKVLKLGSQEIIRIKIND